LKTFLEDIASITLTRDKKEKDQMFTVTSKSPKEYNHTWWYDYGTTNHITSDKNLFSTISDPPNGSIFTTRDNIEHPIQGIGNVHATSPGKEIQEITELLHVPTITTNLIFSWANHGNGHAMQIHERRM